MDITVFLKNIFSIILLALVFIMVNYYLSKKIYRSISNYFSSLSERIFYYIFWTISLCYVIATFGKDILPHYLFLSLLTIGCFYLGVLYYLILFLPIFALIKFMYKKFAPKSKRLKRFLKAIYLNGVFVFIIIGIIISLGYFNSRNIKTTNYNIDISKPSKINSLKVVFLSDVHLGIGINDKEFLKLIDKINNENADLVLLGGDFFDESTPKEYILKMKEGLSNIKSKYGVYAVIGNHEYQYGTVEEIKSNYDSINLLIDEYVKIEDIYLVGRNDFSSTDINCLRKNLDDVISNIDKSKPIIVLDHKPLDSDLNIKNNVDLQLSGHTHNGQFFINQVLVDLMYPYRYGLYTIDNFNIIVSSGYGTWGPPIRVASNSEFVTININFNNKLN
ncbi:MAG: metallophosphoesterase [Clostridium argentinense]|uniref:Metallophosphoesterase n=1 Tax=Clostridium faecium TaxID=2762223 RepID=A0ABR8YSZ1_9CLOT|nr:MULTISPECIES: metallophosphoesterase [Clostridium]MBD8047383.1 metallophosphoesterase [Clostridium faecium]MBS5823537.1 metallophosphoesterase [Clostridium argentinense]MDU1350468.1 metallophosphoesterase [Clostridium argentinense]